MTDFGTLYLVSTPIGNLEDITLRGVRILKEADIIAAEDTRHTGILLKHLEISKKLISYHKFSNQNKHDHVLELLKQGKTVAVCSDAGMPCIADPGQELVRDAIKEGIKVVPIPGANAFLSGLIASGLNTDKLIFLAFFPRKNSEQQKTIEFLKDTSMTACFYESPMRITSTVEVIANAFPDREIVVARELTKIYEEFIRGTAQKVLERLKEKPIKGEIVLLIDGAKIEKKEIDDEDIKAFLQDKLEVGCSLKTAVVEVSKEQNLPKNRVYSIGNTL